MAYMERLGKANNQGIPHGNKFETVLEDDGGT